MAKILQLAIAQDGIALELDAQKVRMLTKEAVQFDSHDLVLQSINAHADLLAGQTAQVTISNALVRYVVLPWQDNIYTRSDWLALAQLAFRQQFGNDADQWQIRVDLQRYGKAVVASALHSGLYEAMQQAHSRHHIRWQSITPAAVSILARVQDTNAWVMMVESGYVVLVMRKMGEVQGFAVAAPERGQEYQAAMQLAARYGAQSDTLSKQILAYVSGNLTKVWQQSAATGEQALLSPIFARVSHQSLAGWLAQSMRAA